MKTAPSLRTGAFAVTLAVMLVCVSVPFSAGTGEAAPRASSHSLARAVVKPDHAGPYSVGYMYESIQPSTKSYTTTIKLFYPAQSAGRDTAANLAAAPYPTVVQLTGFGGDVESLNPVATRMASWGMVVAEFGVNWDDWPYCANISDMEDTLDQLEADNATLAHRLAGMMDKEGFGIHGYSSGGGLCIVDASFVSRFKAVASWASAIGNEYLDSLAHIFWQPIQLQAGQGDSDYNEHARHAYQVFGPPKSYIEITGGTHQGPYIYDALISFLLRYLDGTAEYDNYLYGAGAMDDVANVNYTLQFTLENGSFFPPNMTIGAGEMTPAEDELVDFCCTWDGFLPEGHPRSAFNWDLNFDAHVDVSGPSNRTASYSYAVSGYSRINMWFQLGGFRISPNRTLTINVLNLPPTVTHRGDLAADEDSPVHLAAWANDTPSDLGKLTYSWDFGDGSQWSTSAATDHTYTKSGNYTVKLKVKDDDGEEAQDKFNVTVRNLPPSSTAAGDLTGWKDQELAFTGAGNDTPSDKGTLQYRWEFGDGGQTDWMATPDSVHTYVRSGRFNTTLTVRDNDGAAALSRINVTVLNTPPTAAVKTPQDGAEVNKDEPVDFYGAGSDTSSDAGSLAFRWDFGDGNTSDWSPQTSAAHTYTRGGRYIATLRVRDSDGAEAAAQVHLRVENAPPTVRLISPASPTCAEDAPVRFAAECDDTGSDRPLLNYTWEIDGVTYWDLVLDIAFDTEGARSFKVTVRDPEGAEATATGSITVKNPAPKLSAALSPLRCYELETVNFSCCATDTASDMPILKMAWDFGDGAQTSNGSGQHIFQRAGTYTVKVTATDDEGAADEETFTVVVSARPLPPPNGNGTAPAPGGLSAAAMVGLAVAGLVAVAALLAVLTWRRRKRAAEMGKGAADSGQRTGTDERQ